MRSWILWLVFVSWCAPFFGAQAEEVVSEGGEASVPAGVPEADRLFFLETGAQLRGMHYEQAFPLFVPESWEVGEGVRLALELSHADLLEDSNLTVILNQVTISTIPLTSENVSSRQVVEVPRRAVIPGWNVIRFRSYLRASADPCQDMDNPGLWAIVGHSSFMVLPHQFRPVEPDLTLFPDSYIQPESGNASAGEVRTRMMLPPDITPMGLETALVLASELGRTGHARQGNVVGVLMKGKRPAGLSATHLIFVGTEAQLAQLKPFGIEESPIRKSLAALRRGYPEAAEYGALMEFVSPLNPSKRLLVAVGSDEKGLAILRANVGDPDQVEALSGASKLFLAAPLTKKRENMGDEPKITLSSLNMDDLTLRGVSSRSIRFRVPLPAHWRLEEGTHLKLFVLHSVSLRRSATFEVDFDGTPIFSRELVPDLGAESTRELELTIPIPPELRVGRGAEVRFRLFIDAGTDDCARPYDDSLWAVVRKNSYLYLAHEVESVPDLAQYPDLFVRPDGSGEIGVVVDCESGVPGIDAALSAAVAMGARARQSGRFDLKVETPVAFFSRSDEARAERDWLVLNLGPMAAESGIFRAALPMPLDDEGHVAGSLKISYSIPEAVDDAGILEVLRSPWNSARAVLLASSTTREGMAANGWALGQTWGHKALKGNVAFVSGRDVLSSYSVPMSEALETREDSRPESRLRWIWLLISFMGFGLAYALLRGLRRRERK